MPVIKSAQKQMRQTITRTERNKQTKDAYRAKIKEVKKGIGVLDAKKLQDKLSESYKLIDKAAKKNVLHKNNAARKKSQIARLVKEGKVAKAEKKAVKKKPTATKKK
jgi:small subunit ribosomal protein S20